MKIVQLLHPIKRRICAFATRNFGNSGSDVKTQSPEIKRVLICRPNHRLGNLLLISPLIQEVENTFPDCEIDLLVNQSCAKQLYQNYESVKRILEFPKSPFQHIWTYLRICFKLRQQQYDLAINAVESSSSGRFFTAFSNARFKCVELEADALQCSEKHMALHPVYTLRCFLSAYGISTAAQKPSCLDLRLSNYELAIGSNLVYEMTQNTLPTLCLFTNATGAKCYSENWWLELYTELRKAFPEVNIIEVLPKDPISKIRFKAPTFYSTNLRELGAFIANTDVFITADNGVMHLASASFTPTIGLFSVTDLEKYRPYNEGSLAINTRQEAMAALIERVEQMLYPDLNTSA